MKRCILGCLAATISSKASVSFQDMQTLPTPVVSSISRLVVETNELKKKSEISNHLAMFPSQYI